MNPDFKIDQLDQQILTLLVANARLPFSEIAKKIHVAPGTVHSRMKRLEDAGIVTGTTLKLNYERLGLKFIAYIGIFLSQTSDSESVMAHLVKVPEVTVAHLVTGQYSIYCKIRCRDTRHAKQVIYKINEIDGIIRTESIISLEECINDKFRLIASTLSNVGSEAE